MMLLILARLSDMKKLSFLFLLFSSLLNAQELDSVMVDSIIVEEPKDLFGIYLSLGTTQTPDPVGSSSLGTFDVGIRYKNFESSFVFAAYEDGYQSRIIFPNDFDLLYAYGGGTFAYYLLNSQYYSVAPFVGIYSGDMVWERSDSKEDVFRDKFGLLQIGLKVESPFLRFIRPEFRIGYQAITNLELTGLNNKDFSGIFIGLNVKVGYFNQ